MEKRTYSNPGQPSFLDRGRRGALNFYNMLRDAFGQAAQAILGAITKDSSFPKSKNSNKRMNEMHAGLTELVPNAGNRSWKISGSLHCRRTKNFSGCD